MQKAIEPVAIWTNGQTDEAVVLNLISVNDNLQNSATFYYSLLGAAPVTTPVEGATDPTPTPAMGGATLTQGNLTLGPDQYPEWDGSNAWILDWAAAQLNLTFAPGAEII
jgi:hypothetical protein